MNKFSLSSDLDNDKVHIAIDSDFTKFSEFYKVGAILTPDEKIFLSKKKQDKSRQLIQAVIDTGQSDLAQMREGRRLDKLAQVDKQLQIFTSVQKSEFRENAQNKAFHRRQFVELNKRFAYYLLKRSGKDVIARDAQKNLSHMYKCCDTAKVIKSGLDFKMNFCKNRLCLVCQRIKAGRVINNFERSGLDYDGWSLLTLTVKSENLQKLKKTIRKMVETVSKFRKTAICKSLDNTSFRTIEITFNIQTQEPHPHFHILCRSKDYAEALKNYWLQVYPDAKEICQDIRPFNGNFLELTKYVTKLNFTYPVRFYEVLIYALSGVRQYQTAGELYNLKIDDVSEDDHLNDALKMIELTDHYFYKYDLKNWLDSETGDMLIIADDKDIDTIRTTKDIQSFLDSKKELLE